MNPRNEIAVLIASVDPPGKTRRKPYRKPQAIKDFEQEHMEWYYSTRNVPKRVQSKAKFRDDTANELTKLIVAFIKVQGGFATRLSSTGVYRNDIKKYVRSQQRRGMADIVATYMGQSLNIEVKIGRDCMSKHQQKIKEEIEAAGGHYFIARDFNGFKTWWEDIAC
jgi:hypothetical protein